MNTHHVPRYWCHIYLARQLGEFALVPILIGRRGENMQYIFSKTGAKIRVRGVGSGHKEVKGNEEAPVPLMVAVTSQGQMQTTFVMAVQMTIDILTKVETQYIEFCRHTLAPHTHSQQMIWNFGEISTDAFPILSELLHRLPPERRSILQSQYLASSQATATNSCANVTRFFPIGMLETPSMLSTAMKSGQQFTFIPERPRPSVIAAKNALRVLNENGFKASSSSDSGQPGVQENEQTPFSQTISIAANYTDEDDFQTYMASEVAAWLKEGDAEPYG